MIEVSQKEGRFVRGQTGDRSRNLFWFAQTAHRDLQNDFGFQHFGGNRFD
jgi:hypothetical protein